MKIIAIVLLECLLVATTYAAKDQRMYLDFQSIISHVNSLKTSWTAGHNDRFNGMDLYTIKGMMGSLEEPEHMKLPPKDITPLGDLPEHFDPRQKWPGCKSLFHIRDQSTCGSCWAFGAAEAFTDRICIASGQKTNSPIISAEDLLSCCGFECGNGCNGGFPSGAWKHIQNKGLATGGDHGDTEWCMPYAFPKCDHHVNGTYGPCGSSKPTPKCQTTCQSSYTAHPYKEDKHHVSKSYSIPHDVKKMQTELLKNGPFEVAFTVYSDFLTYKSGVYHHVSGSALGGHAVKLMGWGVENGTPYWLVVNSWNEGWGDKGLFKIRRGNNECGIQGQGVGGDAKL